MRTYPVEINLDAANETPLFLLIARALIDDIRRGRLKQGASLPSSRTLATSLGVHRNTVLAAYRELSAEGWIETTQGKGTFVSEAMPEMNTQRAASKLRPNIATRLGFELPPRTSSYTPLRPAERGNDRVVRRQTRRSPSAHGHHRACVSTCVA